MKNNAQTTENQALLVSFTVFKSADVLSKKYNLDASGNIVKTPTVMTSGTAQRETLDFSDFGETLSTADDKTAFGYGLHDERFGDEVSITLSGKEVEAARILSRTQKYFQYRPGSGVVMDDHDPDSRGFHLAYYDLWTIIKGIVPTFGDAACWKRDSISAGIHRAGEQLQPGNGFHLYNPVFDASDIPRFGKVLFRRLWLAGYGYIGLSAAGTFLERSILDAAVYSPERLDFTGMPVVGNGLAWTPPKPIYKPGGYLDTRLLPDLTPEEERRFTEMVVDAKAEAEPERAAIREEWITRQVGRMVERGVPEERARQALQHIAKDGTRFDLYQDFILDFADGTTASVGDVLGNAKQFDSKALADPFEGTDYGRTTAMFFANSGKPVINSFAHGGVKYFLHGQPRADVEEAVKAMERELNINSSKKQAASNEDEKSSNRATQQIEKESGGLEFPIEVMSGFAGNFARIYAEYLEPPIQFFYMAALTILGNLLSGRVTIDSEIRVQPRLYTLLLGQSADDRKSTAIFKTIEFFKQHGMSVLNICNGVGSAEGLQKKLDGLIPDGEMRKLLLVYDEFKAFVSKCRTESSVLLPCVNSLFENTWYENHTKTGKIELSNVQLSILAASTIETFQSCWTSNFTDIGFNNRLFIVTGEGKRKFSIPPKIDSQKLFALGKELQEVLNCVGELKITPDARANYNEWYLNQESSVHTKRLDTYAMRFMPVLAANECKSQIDAAIVGKAIRLCNWQLRIRQLHDPIDADNVLAKIEERIRRTLRVKGPLSERNLKWAINANRDGTWLYTKSIQTLLVAQEIRLDKNRYCLVEA